MRVAIVLAAAALAGAGVAGISIARDADADSTTQRLAALEKKEKALRTSLGRLRSAVTAERKKVARLDNLAGPKGPIGDAGPQGGKGPQGDIGPLGSARAYAHVIGGASPTLSRAFGFTSVRHPIGSGGPVVGEYCLGAPGLSADSTPALASQAAALPGQPFVANADVFTGRGAGQGGYVGCAAGEFQVITQTSAGNGTNGVAFVVVVP